MKARILPVAIITGLFSTWASAAQTITLDGTVATGTSYTENGGNVTPQADGFRLQLNSYLSAFGVNLGNANWSAYTHLIVTLTNKKSQPMVASIVLDTGTNGWAWSDCLIGPNQTAEFAIPLDVWTLGGQAPTSGGGYQQAPVSGTIVKSQMKRIRIWNAQRSGTIDVVLESMRADTLPARTVGIIDQYGQQTLSFPGKVTSDVDLMGRVAADNALSGQFPYSEDSYGAVAGSARSAGTGKWRVEKQNNKWYIIAPNGNRFFSTGIDGVGRGSLSYIAGREAMFAVGALPSQTGNFAEHYETYWSPSGQLETGFNFYTAALRRKYGANWRNSARDMMARRMRTWGFNTVASGSSNEMYSAASQLPTMPDITIQGNFRRVPTPGGYFPMPDPFDTTWQASVQQTLASAVANHGSNPHNVGMFVDNELPWAWHWGDPVGRYRLAFDVLKSPANQPAKQTWVRSLTMKYRTIQQLNSAWGSTFASWTVLQNNTSWQPSGTPRSLMIRDMQDFLTQFANQYFSTIKTKLRALNYNGLYLGCRFYYYSPEVLAAAKRYCDVVSFNAYDIAPSVWRGDLKTLDKPVLISEFGFGAGDRGRIPGMYPCPINETARVSAYQTYVNDAATYPNLVGIHWYRWQDEPVTGRMWDGSNECLGLHSIADQPYPELVAAASQANLAFQNRLLNP